jgi:SRSO17 transposase
LEAKDIAHVLAVPTNDVIASKHMRTIGSKQATPDAAWVRVKGAPWYDWTVVDVRPLRRRGRVHWVLARRSISEPVDIACYVCFGPADTTVAELARVAESRWAMEECFRTAKNQAGLHQYQVRGYQAWYRHITLSMVAAAFLAITRDDTWNVNVHSGR